MTTDRREITPETAGGYLRAHGVIPNTVDAEARSLGGGVSNHVVEVRWDGDCLILKQPLPNLAVEDDWPADTERVHNEAAAARAYREVIAATGIDARVPAIGFESDADDVIGIECAPGEATMWKRELLDGYVDERIAPRLGELLAAVHTRATGDSELRAEFASKRPFEQLRLDPYHRTTADRHPDVAGAIQAEAERVAAVDRTLVHGDYSPKNVLVERNDDARPWILDFEVAHWGDPAFDVAFMLNHLFIKSVYNHRQHSEYVAAARAFWERYHKGVNWNVEAHVVAELGVLMLARIDGKSPVEYVDEGPVADTLRRIAKTTLTDDLETIDGFVAVVDEEVASL